LVVAVIDPAVEYVFEKTGTSDPAAYPKVAVIVTALSKMGASAATIASESVVQWALSGGVPPAKW
jgi:hypothetical protein